MIYLLLQKLKSGALIGCSVTTRSLTLFFHSIESDVLFWFVAHSLRVLFQPCAASHSHLGAAQSCIVGLRVNVAFY